MIVEDLDALPSWQRELAYCGDCREAVDLDEFAVHVNGRETAYQHECGGLIAVPDEKPSAMAARWNQAIADAGYVAFPHALVRELMRAKILSPAHVALLMDLEEYRRDNATAWPSKATLAENTGLHERTVRKLLGELEGLRLIETAPRQREGGQWPSTSYTRDGLTRVLTAVAENLRDGRPAVDDGVRDLLGLHRSTEGPCSASDIPF